MQPEAEVVAKKNTRQVNRITKRLTRGKKNYQDIPMKEQDGRLITDEKEKNYDKMA